MHARFQQFVDQHLGPCTVETETPWGSRDSYVAGLRDASGQRWFVKLLRDPVRFGRELTAYQRWTPMLEGRAPSMHAYDEELGVLAISAAPGELALKCGAELSVHRDAGAVLRRLHDAEQLPRVDVAARKQEEFERLAHQAGFIFDWRTLDAARGLLRDLNGLPVQPQVPCHHDYSPRNWLVHKGNVHIIDFEWMSGDVWTADLVRLHLGWWPERPDLRDAFLDGYRRTLTDHDLMMLRCCAIVNALFTTLWGRLRGDVPFETSSKQRLEALTPRR